MESASFSFGVLLGAVIGRRCLLRFFRRICLLRFFRWICLLRLDKKRHFRNFIMEILEIFHGFCKLSKIGLDKEFVFEKFIKDFGR